MFAIIETGGKQYKVEKGSKLEVELIEGKEGEKINFDKVLLINDKEKTQVGAPYITGTTVEGTIIGHKRGEKIVVFKMKAKKRYSRTQGHRQELTKIEITDIKAKASKPKKSEISE
jgi:large subunit ribosomal protein L21